MSGYGARCEDCVTCEADDCEVIAYCLSEPASHPCPHDKALCENHNIEGCLDCRLDAEMNMYRSGDYDPRADPLYNPSDNAREYEKRLAEWVRESGFDSTTNTYRGKSA